MADETSQRASYTPPHDPIWLLIRDIVRDMVAEAIKAEQRDGEGGGVAYIDAQFAVLTARAAARRTPSKEASHG
jgi:hypothetical protein